MSFPSIAWINPISVEPDLMVNRERERERLLALVKDCLHPESVGKSILTRWVLDQLKKAPPHPQVALLAVAGRSLRFHRLLRELAGQLADAVEPLAPSLARWLEELRLLANSDRITTEEISRAYAAEASLSAGLLAKLSGMLSWKQEAREGSRIEHSQTGDKHLLNAANQNTLTRVHEEGIAVVLFYGDIDQLSAAPEALENSLAEFIDLEKLRA